MENNSLVTVIIPSFNSRQFVENAILSVINQSYKQTEIIVIDDGSSDDTVEHLKNLQQNIKFTLVEQKNLGPGAARNMGIKRAKGKYLCFLDSDDRLLSNSIEKRINILEHYPDIDLIFNDVLRLDHKNKPGYPFLSKQNFIPKFKQAIDTNIQNFYIFNDKYFDQSIIHFPFIWTSSVMIRKSIIDQVGYFNEQWRGSEDIDYWLRIANTGKVAYLDEALTEWHHYYSHLTKVGNYHFFTDTLSCYKKIRAELGDKQYLKKAINKRLAHYAFAGGYEALMVNDLKQARIFFMKSCRFYPLKLKYWIYSLISLIPSFLFYPLRTFKQKLSF